MQRAHHPNIVFRLPHYCVINIVIVLLYSTLPLTLLKIPLKQNIKKKHLDTELYFIEAINLYNTQETEVYYTTRVDKV